MDSDAQKCPEKVENAFTIVLDRVSTFVNLTVSPGVEYIRDWWVRCVTITAFVTFQSQLLCLEFIGRRKQVVKVIRHKAVAPLHTDGSVIFVRWRQCAPHLVHPNRHPHRTDAAPCWVALSISTAPDMSGHVLGRPLFAIKIAPSRVGIWTLI